MAPRNEEEVLRWVYKRGTLLRVRAKAARVMSTSLVLSMLGGGMVFALNRPPVDVEPAHQDEPIVVVDKTASSSPKPKPAPKPATASPKPKPVATYSPKPKPTETTKIEPKPTTEALYCLNSFDPACGEFTWKTAPEKNQGLVLTATHAGGITGADTAFNVHVADADAKIWREAYKIDFGDGTYTYGPSYKACKKAYGPWTVPVRSDDSYDTTFHHTYATPGTYTVLIKFFSKDARDGAVPCQQAYGSGSAIYLAVTVTDPASPSPSPDPSPTP